MSSTHVRPGEGTHYPMIDGDHVAKAAVRDDLGAFEVFEVRAPAGPPAPLHVSPWTGVLCVLEGDVTVWTAAEEIAAGPGSVVTLPAGTPCTFAVTAGPARLLAVTSGDAAGRFFADLAASVPQEMPPTESSLSAMRAVTARHGVSLAGAPAR
jgi:quercetin dioxygenase-like cupin family protein